ncbi:MAG TPA: GAF and ANTAR domain-containing protein [Amycolatopsis sp.]|nr:GAF and ANTAR domain-containing protein [Amycolatopsis sp.]
MSDSDRPVAAVFTIAQELAEVGRLVDDDDVPATLDRYTRRAVALLPGCHYAAITVATDTDVLDVVASAGSRPLPHPAGDKRMDNPLSEALRHREPRRLDDIDADHRWPAYRDYLRRNGYRSCLSLPLPAAESAAVFSVFSTVPGQFGQDSHDLALLFTLHAGVAFDNATLYHDNLRLLAHVQTALRTRTVIAQAQGLLMRVNGATAEDVFAAMKRASQNANVKLRALAAALVDAHHDGRLDQALAEYRLTAGEADGYAPIAGS